MPGFAAGEPPGGEFMALALDRGAARGEILELAHRAEATAPFSGARGILAQLVAGIGIKRVDRVHAVEPAASAIAALEYLHMNPVPAAALLGAHPGKGDDLQ